MEKRATTLCRTYEEGYHRGYTEGFNKAFEAYQSTLLTLNNPRIIVTTEENLDKIKRQFNIE